MPKVDLMTKVIAGTQAPGLRPRGLDWSACPERGRWHSPTGGWGSCGVSRTRAQVTAVVGQAGCDGDRQGCKDACVGASCSRRQLAKSVTDVLGETSSCAGDLRRAGLRELVVWWGRQMARTLCCVAGGTVLRDSHGGGRPGGPGWERTGAGPSGVGARAVCRRCLSWVYWRPAWEPRRSLWPRAEAWVSLFKTTLSGDAKLGSG